MKNYKLANEEFYKGLFAENGNSVKSLGWGREKSQFVRFEQFVEIFDFKDLSLLDVGCGFGDFYNFLVQNDIHSKKYIGMDIVKENIDNGHKLIKEFPNCTLIQGDFLDFEINDNIDVSILSGILNIEYDNWEEVSKSILDKMWKISSKGIVFNMENAYGLKNTRDLAAAPQNYDPLFWLKYVFENYGHKVIFHSHYHDADFTIGVFK